MNGSEVPGVGVDFAIDAGGSFEALRQIDAAMDSTEARVLANADRIEKATSSMINVGGATAAITAVGNSMTKGADTIVSSMGKAEKAGEALSRQLDRQISSFGKTREEMRQMKVEAAALAAEQQGLTELSARLRAQEAELYAAEYAAMNKAKNAANALAEAKADAARQAEAAAEAEARAMRGAALAYQMFEARARSGVAAMKEQEAAERKAAAATADLEARTRRFIASIDPAAAAQDRFNKEMAEARSLISAGSITLDQYSAKLVREKAAMDATHSSLLRGAKSTGAYGQAMSGAAYQVQDFFTQISMGANPINAFAVQGMQLAGQFSSLDNKAGQIARFFMGPWGIAIGGATLAAGMLADKLLDNSEAAKKAEKAMEDFQNRQSDISNFIDLTTGALIEQNRELVINAILLREKRLEENNAEIAASRKAAFSAARVARITNSSLEDQMAGERGGTLARAGIDPAIQKIIKDAGDSTEKLTIGLAALAKKRPELRDVVLEISSLGGAAVTAEKDNARLRKELAALGGDTKALATSTATLIAKQVDLATATTPLEKARAQLALVQQGATAADKAGGAALEKYRVELTAATKAVKAAEAAEKSASTHRRDASSQARLTARLEREADATEAQARNLYTLADAYGASNAAALIAEARVKAESDAIKKRGDIESFVSRQVQLSIVQRVADSAKSSAAVRDQIRAQADINAMVAAGLVPAERANELVQDRIADLPLLAAIEAAQQRSLTSEAKSATKALEEQRRVRAQMRAETTAAQFNADMSTGRDQLAMLKTELSLIGATDAARSKALTTLKATQEAASKNYSPEQAQQYVERQVMIAEGQQAIADATRNLNDELSFAADRWDLIARNVDNAARGMADAFGDVGDAIGGLASIYANFSADRERLDLEHDQRVRLAGRNQAAIERENARYALATATSQIGLYGDMTSAAKGFFKERSVGYKALEAAEKAFRAVEFALSVRAMAQDAAETTSSIAKSGARTATKAVEAVVSAISSLPFPLNLAAGAATIAALASIGVSIAGSFGGGGSTLAKANDGTGTVLGDSSAKSESIKRAIDSLKEVDVTMLSTSREMAASLKNIESNIGGFAALLVRNGDVNADEGVTTGFATSATGSALSAILTGGGLLSSVPILGDVLGAIGSVIGSLFGTKTSIVGSGLYGSDQTLAAILASGYDADYYSDIKKKKKFFGVTTSTKYSTKYADADPELENQFTLILSSFNDAILAAAGPLGQSTNAIEQRLNNFVVSIGKIDLKDLTGDEIEEKLTAVFGAVADDMAKAAFPGIEKFQQVGEGLFDTLVRVASTTESVTSSLTLLSSSFSTMSVDLKMALADQFDSISDMTSAFDSYFEDYYSKEEQAAARTTQFASVFESLGLSVPSTLAAFRALVEAQDLTTAAGQATYATLIQLAPAFSDMQTSLLGMKSAADIASERADLQRQLYELQGNSAAIRALDLADLDTSNRALQEQIWAIQDAQEAAEAAQQLADAWGSVGDSILDEINRIRGVTDGTGSDSFAVLMGQFNAATAAARGGDQEAAGTLTSLSQSLLTAASNAATSKQELDRVKAQTAASLEATYAVINGLASGGTTTSTSDTLAAAGAAANASAVATASANDNILAELIALRAEVSKLREENNSGHAATASNTGAVKKHLDNVTAQSGGDAIATVAAA